MSAVTPANYCFECGARLVERTVEGRRRLVCRLCGYVHYVNPIVAAGSLVECNDRVLLIRRAVQPGLGSWGLPAGYAEVGETPERTAQRETYEETGLEVEIGDLLGVYAFSEQSPTSGVLVVYAARPVGGTLSPGDDAAEAGFFRADQLPQDIAFRTHRAVLSEWARARRLTYREARAEEIAVCKSLAEAEGLALSQSLETHLHDDRATLIVAADEGALMGCAALVRRSAEGAEIKAVFVQRAYRRWGIATRLLDRAEKIARDWSLSLLEAVVPVQSAALLFFLRAGFFPCELSRQDTEGFLRLCRSLGNRGDVLPCP